jgi:sugar O-acyltransferase (sialic acid O-acetyltransferase NeuD family)
MTDRFAALPYEMAVIGAGSYGAVIAELAESCGYRVALYLDDDPAKQGILLDGVPVSVPIEDALRSLSPSIAVSVAIGDNDVRRQWLRKAKVLGYQVPALISPHAVVSKSATVEEGVYLHPFCHVWTRARIGFGCILSPHATVAHHTELGEGCFVSTGANVGASIRVGEAAFFGIGSVTSTDVQNVAEHSLIGAGAVLIRDTQKHGVYVGSPGRCIKVNSA